MTYHEFKEFLDAKVVEYNNPKFIESDPIQRKRIKTVEYVDSFN